MDEAIIPFKGRSPMKQYMPKKPIKRGFKVWTIADAHNGCVEGRSVSLYRRRMAQHCLPITDRMSPYCIMYNYLRYLVHVLLLSLISGESITPNTQETIQDCSKRTYYSYIPNYSNIIHSE